MAITSWLRATIRNRAHGHPKHHHCDPHANHGHGKPSCLLRKQAMHTHTTPKLSQQRPQALIGSGHHEPTCPFFQRARPLVGGLHLHRKFGSSAVVRASPFSQASGFWRETLPDSATIRNGKFAGKGRALVWAQVIETIAESSARQRARAGKHKDGFWSSGAYGRTRNGTGSAWSGAHSSRSHAHTSHMPRAFSTFKSTKYFDMGHRGKRLNKRIHHASPAILVFRHTYRVRARTGLTYFLSQGPTPQPTPSYRAGNLMPRSRSPLAQIMPRVAVARPASLTNCPSVLRASFLPRLPVKASHTPSLARSLTTSARRCGHPILYPVIGVLKSSSALSALTVITRLALSALPLSLRGKLLHSWRERYLRDPASASTFLKKLFEGSRAPLSAESGSNWSSANARYIFPALLAAPLVFFGLIVAASIERTPVTGRLRVIMLSPQEEADLTSSILAAGQRNQAARDDSRDWITIVRSVLELPDEGTSTMTGRRILLGAEVLDERDWRYRWTQAILRKLEAGIPTLAQEQSDSVTMADCLVPPPTRYPLKPRTTAMTAQQMGWKGHLLLGKGQEGYATEDANLTTEYELVLLDSPEANAFSFGFGVDHQDLGADSKGRRGVIVVYTGFIQEVLGDKYRAAQAAVSSKPCDQSPQSRSLLGFLSSEPDSKQADPLPNAISENLMPSVLPDLEQTQRLAVLLSHELAHLVLSHTLESYASTSLLFPHVSKLFSDLIRTFTFPFTAILGPFFNDAIGRTINEGASTSFGFFGRAAHACESRKLEVEADLVALRILSNAGIDPRVSLDFWNKRLQAGKHSDGSTNARHASPHLHLHSAPNASKGGQKSLNNPAPCCAFNSHPLDEERVRKIEQELHRWASWQPVARRAVSA
ncbi:hypothetical protein OIV83_005606 [Microbotryomycetes sp. JL201]|nr:hypothetical protein OIV83_005606 [Microbotryomycetes sp. JL201]